MEIDLFSFGIGCLATLIAEIAIIMLVFWLADDRRCTNCGEVHDKKRYRWKGGRT